MKTTEISIRKLVAEEGKILVSKKTIEISEDLTFPESYGTEIYLGVSASSEDFEEVDLEHFETLQSKVEEYRRSQEDFPDESYGIAEDSYRIPEVPEEQQETEESIVLEDSDDSN